MSDVFGFQAVRSVLRDAPDTARCLYVAQGRRDARVNELIGLARAAHVRFTSVDAAWFKRRVDQQAHQGVLLECHDVAVLNDADLWSNWDALPPQPLFLILDEISDPRNLGACLRTANGAGVDALIVPKRNSAPLSPVALKTAQGGQEGVAIYNVTNLARTLKALKEKGVWLIGTDGSAAAGYTAPDYTAPTAIVLGSEGKGLRRLTRELCDTLVSIPMQGSVSSLNVSVAAGVVLYEVLRQRSQGLASTHQHP